MRYSSKKTISFVLLVLYSAVGALGAVTHQHEHLTPGHASAAHEEYVLADEQHDAFCLACHYANGHAIHSTEILAESLLPCEANLNENVRDPHSTYILRQTGRSPPN